MPETTSEERLTTVAVMVLHNDVPLFYRVCTLPMGAVPTDNGWKSCGMTVRPFELYLVLNNIEHRRTKVRHACSSGANTKHTSMLFLEDHASRADSATEMGSKLGRK